MTAMVAEVTNTPWHERHCYVMGGPGTHFLEKALHVSPFLGMDLSYRVRFTVPGEMLSVSIEVSDDVETQMFAGMTLWRRPADRSSLAACCGPPGGAPWACRPACTARPAPSEPRALASTRTRSDAQLVIRRRLRDNAGERPGSCGATSPRAPAPLRDARRRGLGWWVDGRVRRAVDNGDSERRALLPGCAVARFRRPWRQLRGRLVVNRRSHGLRATDAAQPRSPD